jgi:hypothetical protein
LLVKGYLAKYDKIHNYEFSRSQRAIPIIDYSPRTENLSPQALKTKGHACHDQSF